MEYVIDGGDLEFVLSYEENELSFLFEYTNELMLKDQEMYRRQIENFGYVFIHGMREVILTDNEDEEDGETVTDDDEDVEDGETVTSYDEEGDEISTDDEEAHHQTP
ncbi:hypothetical protein E2562_014543 [Oryza meyeriana var. granulata]|nr:hypothetical protein E2562_014543 [Oryza meyeriana var. granulata]